MNIRNWLRTCNAEWTQHFDVDSDEISKALFLAIEFGDWQSTQILALAQLDIDATDHMGDWTALMRAVHEGSFETVKLLVELGADVNLRGALEPDKDFALNLAAYARNQEIFDYLFPLTIAELQKVAVKTLDRN
ncbi:hypothetical protein NIES2135_35190 [Leptolyngbya boryana NIES-2135]|jgi:ankyrin repeat protein|uniref:Uncharacterized protein n=1 Tax=Leptolyngbya boryana NIES-2135 TaxID=1973484 RepID=A0A1Z4JJ35_LEPBY|nr:MULTISPECIES: ankyrin repeat domain-containing protein [Leptolyngbya]BAY56683.1 hypothetical protein NIES2135_35190 [Leptolyngbya boryana NIES-2135]MBD2369481.1 ankyrin repeat domain-containing protein [Leptolyngbya sp. FACHB-161]MBD2376774.1 ankyrin repeat domain-containing protein [Leptolyngbya sp. FACHB-238]MBD2401141.1 ankyrin repeat domain-containing protein [Leptolyngbya sp. FACHB-239]MBD2407692.1 ankyrin repeat domain-containing protein [Leptolyngbya sp. FACHB-402]